MGLLGDLFMSVFTGKKFSTKSVAKAAVKTATRKPAAAKKKRKRSPEEDDDDLVWEFGYVSGSGNKSVRKIEVMDIYKNGRLIEFAGELVDDPDTELCFLSSRVQWLKVGTGEKIPKEGVSAKIRELRDEYFPLD